MVWRQITQPTVGPEWIWSCIDDASCSLNVLIGAERGPGGRYYWCVAASIFCGSSAWFEFPTTDDYVTMIIDPARSLIFALCTLCPAIARSLKLQILWQKSLTFNHTIILIWWLMMRISTQMNRRWRIDCTLLDGNNAKRVLKSLLLSAFIFVTCISMQQVSVSRFLHNSHGLIHIRTVSVLLLPSDGGKSTTPSFSFLIGGWF